MPTPIELIRRANAVIEATSAYCRLRCLMKLTHAVNNTLDTEDQAAILYDALSDCIHAFDKEAEEYSVPDKRLNIELRVHANACVKTAEALTALQVEADAIHKRAKAATRLTRFPQTFQIAAE